MPRPLDPKRILLLLAALVAAAATVAGCGTSTADEERGRLLFIENCGNCHTLAQAGTSATIGPDLDDAFAAARDAGQTDSTIAGVTEGQIDNPRPMTSNPAVSMPPDILTGQDAKDVAAYVGEWAGVPGAEPPKVPGGPGAQVFANNGCGGCHTLAEANTGGSTGPNLDEVLPGQSAAMIHKQIVEPDSKITKGFPAGVMPSDYETLIDQKELDDLVAYLVSATSKGGGGSR
jgi:mono/diheme cytochrome c family protein